MGFLIHVEKTIPLEKITDTGMEHGPIIRAFDLHTLTVETAGQSGVGSLVSLTGAVKAPRVSGSSLAVVGVTINTPAKSHSTPSGHVSGSPDIDSLLTEIRGSIVRIESIL